MTDKKSKSIARLFLAGKYTSKQIKDSLAVHPPKYRDPQTGKTWSGRGRIPKWIEGKDRENFLIKENNKTV